MMFVALNEFNEELLKEAANQLQLRHIQRLFSLHKTETETEDVYDSDYLEPWVQWVSVQTGEPSQKHQIKHLGDAPDTSILQIWEKLSRKGISSGIWGAMNARKRSADQCLFFLPDPWTAQEMGAPDELNALLIPLRQISKNYTHYSTWELAKTLSSFFKLLRSHRLCTTFFKEGAKLVKNLVAHRGKPFVFVSFLDLLSAKLFLKYKKAHHPKFCLLFLNSIAHLQHHQWKQGGLSSNAPLAHGFRNIDRILGELFEEMDPGEILIVANALSQVNTEKDPPWILYRQINHQKFLQAIGIQDAKVEAHMTHDAHLFFPNETSLKNAAKILERVTIEGRPLFLVEPYREAPCKLFYKIIFTGEIKKEAFLDGNGLKIPFYNYFKSIVKRTGKHIQTGTLFSSAPLFPPRVANHEIGTRICEYLETFV